MTYRVDLSKHARRGFNRVPFDVAVAVGALFDGLLASTPHRVGSVLLDPPLAGVHRAKRGEYVVLYDTDDDAMVVRVRRIEHRRTVYGRALRTDGRAVAVNLAQSHRGDQLRRGASSDPAEHR